jgi:ParB-like chromosome segregation protein Spo0J
VEIELVPIDSIHPDPANANMHSEEDIRSLMAKLSAFTQVEPLVVQLKTRKVIGGNGRLEAMRRLGWTEVEVNFVDVDNVTATAMGIALNKRQSELDDEIVRQHVLSLDSEGFDLDTLGFTSTELEHYLESDDGDDADGEEGEAENPEGSQPDFSGTLRYELIFDDVAQQGRWFAFTKWLKGQREFEAETLAGRLDKFLLSRGPVA